MIINSFILGAAAAWAKGFNFRSTSGYVTDGTDETYVLAADSYPVTRNGVTFGLSGAVTGAADRDSALDRRLAGIVFCDNSGSQYTFRVDLPATGNYRIRLALGDAGGAQGYQYVQVKDDTSVLFAVDDTDGTAEDNFDDAGGNNRAAAAWPTDNVAVDHTFATTTLLVLVGSPADQAGFSTLAHFSVVQL